MTSVMGRCLKVGLWNPILLIIEKQRNLKQLIGLWSPTLLIIQNQRNIQQMIELWSPTLLMIQKERNIQQMIELWSPILLMIQKERNIQQMIGLWSLTLLIIQKEGNIQQMIGLWSPTLLKQGNPKQICMDRFSLKFSSCSTIFLEDSTASCPHFETTLKSVALDFYFLIKDREGYLSYKIFDEHAYPLKYRTEEYIMYDPSETMIYKFIRTLFYVKSLKVAVAIIIMVYIQRLIRYSRIYICSATWRRIILGAILVAIKVRSNVPVCNKDLCRRFEKTTVDDLNKLEMNFLELINYDTNVSKSIYTVYYFRLRDLVYTYGLGSPICLLDTQRAWDLQALSRMEQDEVFYTACKTGSLSVDDLTSLQRAKAILS
ncbi:cyclin-Y-like protein 2 isoform X10 [Callithrix jacchus]